MITVNQSYRLNGATGSSAVSYTMGSDNTCVSVTPASGTVTPGETVEFTFVFDTVDCFTTNFTLTTSDDICTTPVEYDFSIASPCSTLDGTISNVPSLTNPFIFTLSSIGGSSPYTIAWQYNTAFFIALNQSNTQLVLNPINSSVRLPDSTIIRATITDSKGCTKTVSYTYNICQPVSSSQNVSMVCIPSQTQGPLTVTAGVGGIELEVTQCAGTTTDWTTLTLDYDSTKLYPIVTDDNILTVYAINSPTTTRTLTFTVRNNYGILSTVGTIALLVPTCGTSTNLVQIQNTSTKLLTGDTVKYLDVSAITFTA